MSDKPLVTVIIIFLDAAKFIEESLDSVFAQTYCEWELILVDASEANLFEIEMELSHECDFRDYRPILGRVQNRVLMDNVFRKYRPSVVFHAAAYKHVPMVEINLFFDCRNGCPSRLLRATAALGTAMQKLASVMRMGWSLIQPITNCDFGVSTTKLSLTQSRRS